jgi:predicted GNAT family acetyltransferase
MTEGSFENNPYSSSEPGAPENKLRNAETNAAEVVNNEGAKRFEVVSGDTTAFLTYSYVLGDLNLIHTEVPPEFGRRDAGITLVKFALEFARSSGLKIIPTCPLVRRYLRKHPEYLPLVSSKIKLKK